MLRLGPEAGMMPPAPPEEQMAPAPMMPEAPAQLNPMDAMGGIVAPEAARYMGPESRCMSCVHFMEPGTCEVVAGPIDPMGVCIIYTPDTDVPAGQGLADDQSLPTDGGTSPTEEAPTY